MTQRVLVVVAARAPARVEEALRAALGVTLRGAHVAVLVDPAALATPLARRAAATLASFGHRVEAPGAAWPDADVVEVWTDGASAAQTWRGGGARRVLHLLPPDAAPPAPHPGGTAVALGQAPRRIFPAPAPLTWAEVRDHVAAADLVITW